MANDLKALVYRLAAKTQQGKVPWQRTVDDGVYQAAFASYTVKLFDRKSRYLEDGGTDYVLQIIDPDGTLLEETDDYSLSDGDTSSGKTYHTMQAMHRSARRKALGIDVALKTLLSELGDDDDRSSDDDVPF